MPIDPKTQALLSGITNSAGLGAGLGALGMGAANLMQPNEPDPNNPGHDQHKRSLLKSMLLGGAMGGLVGGGARSAWDAVSPAAAADSGSHLQGLFNSTSAIPKQNPGLATAPHVHSNWLDQILGSEGPSRFVASTGIGTSAGVLRKFMNGERIRDLAAQTGTDPKKTFIKDPNILSRKFRSPFYTALLSGLTAYGLGAKVHPGVLNERLNAIPKPQPQP